MSKKKVIISTVISPLRYPGGKKRLTGYIKETLQLNELHPNIFVEPFAGGASVSIYLLTNNIVDNIVLGEIDPMLASFWKTVFNDSDWLIKQINETEVTLKKWNEIKKSEHESDRERAFACLFLNRTNFSGILRSEVGPIGGKNQSSQYKIDCRFPKESLILRIKKLSLLQDRVLLINNGDWKTTIEAIKNDERYKSSLIFYYLDPPFFKKADGLYQYYFNEEQHKDVCRYMSTIKEPWLVSYDPEDTIIDMYSNNGYSAKRIDVLYSPAKVSSHVAKEIILTNLEKTPDRTTTWCTDHKK